MQEKRISRPNDQKYAKQDQLTGIAVRVFAMGIRGFAHCYLVLPGIFLAPANGVVPFLTETVLRITLLSGIQTTRSEESMQKTCSGSAGCPGRRAKSGTSGDCPRDRASRGADNCAPGSLAGQLPASRSPWSGLGSQTEALIYITLGSLRSHFLEMLIWSQNWALSRTGQAGKNNCQT